MGLTYSTDEQKGTTAGLVLLAVGFLGALIGTIMGFMNNKVLGGALSFLLIVHVIGLIVLPLYAQKRMDAVKAKYDSGNLADENWKMFGDKSDSNDSN